MGIKYNYVQPLIQKYKKLLLCLNIFKTKTGGTATASIVSIYKYYA